MKDANPGGSTNEVSLTRRGLIPPLNTPKTILTLTIHPFLGEYLVVHRFLTV